MTPKIQVGTILIEEWSLVRQRRCCENNLFSRMVDNDAGQGSHNRYCFGAIGVALSRGIYDAIRPTATKR